MMMKAMLMMMMMGRMMAILKIRMNEKYAPSVHDGNVMMVKMTIMIMMIRER